MYTLPAWSTATPCGRLSPASVAAPPSPTKPPVELPAMVVMIPFETLRIRLLLVSAM